MEPYKNICIWCLKLANNKDVEHIFPESLGCPSFMTLPGNMVCKKCNNELAPLDRAVLDEFDFITFQKGIRRKNNKMPEISSRGNVVAKHTKSGPEYFINAENHKITLDNGTQLTSYKPNNRSIKPEIEITGASVSISMNFEFGQGKKFIRGLTKIAINCFVYKGGYDNVISRAFDNIRNYVKHGGEKRKVLIIKAPDDEYVLAIESITKNEAGQYAVVIRIGFIHFIIDLSPDGSLIDEISKAAMTLYGEKGWTIIPQ